MNKLSIISASLAAVILTACGGGGQQTESVASETDASAAETTFVVNNDASTVAWKGEVAGVYGHEGVIEIAEGTVTTKGNQIVGGKIVIDMTTIQPTDSASYKDEDGRRASDLVGHLSTGDFFLVEEFPTASFVIKSHNGNELVGDLTVRGITKEVKAQVNALEVSADGLKADAVLVFNRQDFKVSWVHFMKDMVLSDDIQIKLNIVGAKG